MGIPAAPVVQSSRTALNSPASADKRAARRAAIAAAVESMPALPVDGTRYAPRPLTALWLETLRSDNTARSYRLALHSWLTYCEHHDLDPIWDPRRADVDGWVSTLTATAPTSVNARLSAVSSWYQYLLDNDAADRNPVAAVKRPKPDRDVSGTPSLSAAEVGHLLRYLADEAETGGEREARDYALLRLMLTCGLRTAPVLDATVADVVTTGGHRVLTFRAKGGKRQRVPLPPKVWHAIEVYLGRRSARLGRPLEPGERLFVSVPWRGKPGDGQLWPSQVREILQRQAKCAGIEGACRLTPHSTRHSAVSEALRHRSLAEVQDFVGHADPRTTRGYDSARNNLDRSPAYALEAEWSKHES